MRLDFVETSKYGEHILMCMYSVLDFRFLSTIKPINHQTNQPLSLSTIEPINHRAY